LRQLEAAKGSTTPKILRVDEAELNSYLQALSSRNQAAPGQDASVKDLRIRL